MAILKGFRDCLPESMIPRQRTLRSIEKTFESFGFLPMDTPALEYSELLLSKSGGESESLLYRFMDNGKRDVALRYDLTVPLKRIIDSNPQLALPFRRYQIAPVWRAEKPGPGRFREFLQCDVDIVGTTSLVADADCIAVGITALLNLGLKDFKVKVSNRKILNRVLAGYGVEGEAAINALRILDKLPKIGEEEVRRQLNLPCAEELIRFITEGLDDSLEGSSELKEVFSYLEMQGLSDYVEVDLSIARGLDYYTGTVYETFVTGREEIGSVMSGGRYDNLMRVPAVGLSIGIDRLLTILNPESEDRPRYLVTVFDQDCLPFSYKVARLLRDQGLDVTLYPDTSAKMKKQLKYADKNGFSYVIIVGPSEVQDKVFTIKNMSTGNQENGKMP